MQAGYSQRPLAAKLGIKSGMTIALVQAPEGYLASLAPLPEALDWRAELTSASFDFIQYFTSERGQLNTGFTMLKDALRPNGMLWISWPKAAAKMPTDLNENIVRQIGLDHGLVDVKVAAVDLVWSALKFVYRLSDRASTTAPQRSKPGPSL